MLRFSTFAASVVCQGLCLSALFCSYSSTTAISQSKVRINILYLSGTVDIPLLQRETFEKHLPQHITSVGNNVSSNAPLYPGSWLWTGNDLLENVEVYLNFRDTTYNVNFNLQHTMATMLELLVTKSTCSSTNKVNESSDTAPVIHMIVGPGFSSEAKAISQLTSFYNLVLISGSASSPALSDRSRYPNYFRTCPSDGDGPDVIANVLTHFGYNQINGLYEDEGYVTDFRQVFEPRMAVRGINVENSFVYKLHDHRTYKNIADELSSRAKSHVWIIAIFGNQFELFCSLYKFGQVTGKTFLGFVYGLVSDSNWLNVQPLDSATYSDYLYRNECTAEQIREVFSGAIQIAAEDASWDDQVGVIGLRPSEFKADVDAALALQNANSTGDYNKFYSYQYHWFDALTAAALALDRTEYDLKTRFNSSLAYFRYNDTRAAKGIIKHLTNMSFQGLTGKVEFLPTGDRSHITWTLRQFQGAELVNVGRYQATNATSYNITIYRKLVFSTEDGEPPPQFGSIILFATPENITVIVLAGVAAALLCTAVGLYVRRWLKNSELRALLINKSNWLINQRALVENDWARSRSQYGAASNISLTATISSKTVACGSLSRTSITTSVISERRRAMRANLPFLPYKYEGVPVCLFSLGDEAAIDRKFANQLLRIQTFSHDNLSRFVGIVQMVISDDVDLKTLHVIMGGGSKGSLSEFLLESNEEVELCETCEFSILKDLYAAQGLAEVHKRLGFHGRLSSTGCMIDNRLSLRISDYGFGSYRQQQFFGFSASKNYERFLWTAPKVLQQALRHKRSDEDEEEPIDFALIARKVDWVKNDVYSFGIIVAELFTRCSPPLEDEVQSSTAQIVIEGIADGSLKAQNLWKSKLKAQNLATDIYEFAQTCMSHETLQRPSLADIETAIRSMLDKRKLPNNLTELLMQRLETYATDLARLVEQRTSALVEEEKKVRRLLYQILPPSIADALKNGESVPPQTYESVTVYFSDIVGFTAISAQSTPLEVVDLLNDLYNTFDMIISQYDVYKVETIGDAYMVVSGLPRPNELEHARHIIRLSIALIDHVTRVFKIRHRPNEQLLLRIGLHTGPCAAGVVGFVMPRYCLFGDTVNTASRMESSGEALKIHASDATVQTLRDLYNQPTAVFSKDGCQLSAEFVVEPRGNVDIKGKGLMRTYWVTKSSEKQIK